MEKINTWSGLTASQTKAAIMLARGSKPDRVSSELNIDRSTFWRWRQHPLFRAQYEHELLKWKEELRSEFQARQMDALAALDRLMVAEDSSLSFRAATYVLDFLKEIPAKDYNIHREIREAASKEDSWVDDFDDSDWSLVFCNDDKYSTYCKALGVEEQPLEE